MVPKTSCMKFRIILLLFFLGSQFRILAQVVINEGSNKNYQTISDENGDAPDWIELFNSGSLPFDLTGFFLTDDPDSPQKWSIPSLVLDPNEYKIIFCSGKDRLGGDPFQFSLSQQNFTPVTGWNTHVLSTPFVWDGVSNIVLNICSYNNSQYTENSIVRQTSTTFPSTVVSFADGSPSACSSNLGAVYNQRPNLKFNGIQVGNGSVVNTATDYPAPYGNWYWGARHQFLIKASELQAAGLSAGPINSIAFDVVSTIGEFYNYLDISITSTPLQALSTDFLPENGYQLHTNFKLNGNSETVYLLAPDETFQSSLAVETPYADVSIGSSPDASTTLRWMNPTPGASNNASTTFTDTLRAPVLSRISGIQSNSFYLKITDPNTSGIARKTVYTLNSTEPLFGSPVFPDSILIDQATVIRVRTYPLSPSNGYLPSEQSVATYLFNVDHETPILMVTTDPSNLYGSNGIFDNFNSDWIKPAHAVYLKETNGHPLAFKSKVAMRMDGGAGGSRSHAQHSFRLTFDHGALGEKTIEYPIIPDRENRTSYSDIYLRNGSNQWKILPYKDASQVRMMSEGTNNYYSAYRPVTVYVNGEYFGLYELREKFNTEYFEVHDGANRDSIELLSLSYFYNLVLRAVEGDVQNFWNSYAGFLGVNPGSATFMEEADQFFDMNHYTDYIISESWMGNTDWPHNNIKIYRSDKTQGRWRFALIDLELAMQPNGWTDCNENHIRYMLDRSPDIPYINIWLRGIQNTAYRNYFINRFADQINTSYSIENLWAFETSFYQSMFPEMPNEFARWGDPGNISGQMQEFQNNHLTFRNELACRNNVIQENLINEFGLVKEVEIKLEVFPDSTGKIGINTIKPENYPWIGTYFDGVPVKMEALPQPGFEFSHWEPNPFISDTLNPVFEGNIDVAQQNFKAIFKAIPPPPDGPEIHFTLFPNPSAGDLFLQHDNKTLATGCTYEIFDLNGRLIQSGSIDNTSLSTPINVTNLRATIYFLSIRNTESVIETIRFIKM